MMNLDATKLIALKLSMLNNSDFDWVYSQLAQDVKDELEPIVREIKEIGFEIDSETMHTINQNNLGALQGEVQDEHIRKINSSNFNDISEIFKYEPPVIFNTLVGIYNWSWRKDQGDIYFSTVNSQKIVGNINNKKLLKKSIISTTSRILANSNNKKLEKNNANKLKHSNFLTNYLNKFFGLRKKW